MKRCPECRRNCFDDTLSFCLEGGTSLAFSLWKHADVDIPILIVAKQEYEKLQ